MILGTPVVPGPHFEYPGVLYRLAPLPLSTQFFDLILECSIKFPALSPNGRSQRISTL